MSDLKAIISLERSRHHKQIGDYRSGYRTTCSLCYVLRSEPGYNERTSWIEREDWPCKSSQALDEALDLLDPEDCTCGYGGIHEPLNPKCARNDDLCMCGALFSQHGSSENHAPVSVEEYLGHPNG